jgi:hypothetical protein
MEYRYKALQIKQTSSDKKIALFAAPATDIDQWSGVPQKKQFGTDNGEESVGFQREENMKRVESLGEFCGNEQNIIQNPLLCSTRRIPVASTSFEPNQGESGDTQEGTLVINTPEYESFSMEEILAYVRDYLETRVPELAEANVDEALIAKLKALAASQGHIQEEFSEEKEDDKEDDDQGSNHEMAEAEAALFEESHIVDFWQEVACRQELIKLMESPPEGGEFLGFTRGALISYLKPIVLVDGQHRLRGALSAAEAALDRVDIQEEIETRVTAGESPESIQDDILNREVRRLPISLLLTDDPAEQVFQFVVVNQKATPIGRALLGTIVSTTLSNEEMAGVASRLKDAGIPLEESQAITFLARHPESPFYGLVERGLAGDKKDLLPWNVLSSLVSIFRDLRGGKLFGYKNDYAEAWKARFLESSEIVSGFDQGGLASAFEYWRQLDGPWRDVFIQFFNKIRDEFGDRSTEDAHNYWGKPRHSNLFNKISLTILASDFFQYLVETRQTIESADRIPELVDDWLDGVARNYFNRDWNLSGTKKDSSGIRKQWAYQWNEYRKNPSQLPQARIYRNPKGD